MIAEKLAADHEAAAPFFHYHEPLGPRAGRAGAFQLPPWPFDTVAGGNFSQGDEFCALAGVVFSPQSVAVIDQLAKGSLVQKGIVQGVKHMSITIAPRVFPLCN